MIRSLGLRVGLLIALAVAAIGTLFALVGPYPQPLWYHAFADQRTLWGVPHALNVLSNFPFVLFGLWGIAYLASDRSERPGAFVERTERIPYWVFFVGLALTGLGSGYYHADPGNAKLAWDRAPLTIAFMGLFVGVLAERVHVACARCLLWPLVLAGVASVVYWDWTERAGAGDLRPYFAVQFFPLIALVLLLTFYPARYTRTGDLVASLTCYVFAKALESLDGQIYDRAGFVSGHTLKHLVAGGSAAFVLLMLAKRRPRPGTNGGA